MTNDSKKLTSSRVVGAAAPSAATRTVGAAAPSAPSAPSSSSGVLGRVF